MSAELIQHFIPALTRCIQSHPFLSKFWHRLFPSISSQSCTTPQLSLQVNGSHFLTLRWLYASLCCLLGIIIGFSYGARLLRRTAAAKQGARRGEFTWGCAFLWYGLMSVGGLFHHCLSPTRLFYLMDVISTACSSFSIVAACCAMVDDREWRWRMTLLGLYVLTVAMAIQGSEIVQETLYLLPATTAVLCGALFCVKEVRSHENSSARLAWLAMGVGSAMVGIGGVVVDQWLCTYLGPHFTLLFFVFLGSDLALLSLFHFAMFPLKDHNITSS